MTIEPRLIQEARAAVEAFESHVDSEGVALRQTMQYVRRQMFLAMLEDLLLNPESTVTGLAEQLGEDVMELPGAIAQNLVEWLYFRLDKEMRPS